MGPINSEEIRELAESLDIGLWKYNLTDFKLDWDTSVYSRYGVHREAFPRPDDFWAACLTSDSLVRAREEMRAVLAGEKDYHGTYELRLPSGETRFVLARATLVRDANGRPQFLYGMNMDVTEQTELQQLVERERAKSIQSARLSSLGELSAGIAHEINNPLSIIVGSVELLSRCVENPERVKERVEAIQGASRRIEKIVSGLKKFSRSDKASVFAPYSINAILEDALVLVEAKARRLDTKIIAETGTDARIVCDNLQIEQVLINLISNAIDATRDASQKWVRVSSFEQDSDLVLRVTDSGPGIPEKVREKLFTPFFTTKKIGEGTGLGLTISKGILDDHGATIELNTSVENTCFELRFKRVDAAHAS